MATNQDKSKSQTWARTEPEARIDRPADERALFPSATDPGGDPPETAVPHPGAGVNVRTAAEEAEAARLSREAAENPIDVPGRSLLAIFDGPTVARALKIQAHEADRLVDVLLVRLGKGPAEERAVRFIKAVARITRGDSVDDVLRDAGREAGADQPRVERR